MGGNASNREGTTPNGNIWVSLKEGDPNSSQFGYFLKIIYPNYNLGKLIPQIGSKFNQIGKNIPKWEILQIGGHNLWNMALFG